MAPYIVHSKNVLEPKNQADVTFVLSKEGQLLSEVQLPSGIRVARGTADADWFAVEGMIALKLSPELPMKLKGFLCLRNDLLHPESECDLKYLKIASGCGLSGSILPSGAQVPEAPRGCSWIVVDDMLKLTRVE